MRHYGFSKESLQFIQFISDKRRSNGIPYIRNSIVSEAELQDIAKLYMQDVFENPEGYVALPTANTLDYSRFFKNSKGKDISTLTDLDLLESYLDASNEQLKLWASKRDGGLSNVKLEQAALTSKRRVLSVREAAEKLLSTDIVQAVVAAQILSFVMRFCVRINGAIRLVKIKDNNTHSVMYMNETMISFIAQQLPQQQSIKKACAHGIAKYHKSLQQAGMPSGWRKFAKSSSYGDAEKLQVACIGTSWCISEDAGTASDYLQRGSFYIYFDNFYPVVAVHICDEGCEIYGANEGQEVEPCYESAVEHFLIRQNLIYEGHDKYITGNDKELIGAIVSSIYSGKPEQELFKYLSLEMDSKIVRVNPIVNNSCVISSFVYEQLRKVTRIEDVLEYHDDGTVTVYANVDMGCNLSLTNRVVEIKGNLILSYCSEVEFPCLKRIGGYLDIRNASNIKLPLLAYISGDLDATGSSNVSLPELVNVQGDVIDWGNETYSGCMKRAGDDCDYLEQLFFDELPSCPNPMPIYNHV